MISSIPSTSKAYLIERKPDAASPSNNNMPGVSPRMSGMILRLLLVELVANYCCLSLGPSATSCTSTAVLSGQRTTKKGGSDVETGCVPVRTI